MARYVVAKDQKNTAIVAIIGLCIQQAKWQQLSVAGGHDKQ